MNYYDKLKPFEKQLTIIKQTNSISTKDKKVEEKVTKIIAIYAKEYGLDVNSICKGCTGTPRALRRVAKDYFELKESQPKKAPKKPEPKKQEVNYSEMKMQDLRKQCKAKGIATKNTDKKQDLISKLNNHE